LELISLRTNSFKGLIRRNSRNGAGYDLILELLRVEYLELFPTRSTAVLLVILSLPVQLERCDTIASPKAMREWAMYPMREVR